ncbi:hypothetical protein EDC01DRAFT_91892 [Geopyxis carbonaria]|nr:hypothetical protein EDC01DRAFT_91892 [Geopyxis carbonaria]
MVLTPTTNLDTTPGLSVPASPPHSMAIASSQIPRASQHSNGIYSSRPPMHYSTASPASRPKPRPRLTRDAVAKIGKDSRLARWERVLGYVRDQRSNTPQPAAGSLHQSMTHTHIAGEPDSTPGWATYVSGHESPLSTTPPSRTQDRKRRASELAAIEAKTKLLDQVDLAEQDLRSLWSGGSGGTNGVDEFVWSEDDDDDILPMPQAPPPAKPLPQQTDRERDDMIFEMDDAVAAGMKSAAAAARNKPRTSWGFGRAAHEDMPMLCREAELEGGLGRLVGRRMSAAY